jgi:cytochrome oxidase Cu insertion factor (SCO1/SenC/PrrC family)
MDETDLVSDTPPAGNSGPPAAANPTGPAVRSGPWARRRPRRSTVVLAVVALVGGLTFASLFAFGVTWLTTTTGSSPMRPTGIPASVSTRLAGLMQLSPVPPATAPGFTLTDQSGHPVSLASFRGKTVVLTFMDSHCTDICPLVSREFIDANRDLGPAARNVVFIAVNVNPYHRRIADMAAYSGDQQLDSIPSWHFVTGPLPSLRKVWNGYQIQVDAPSRNADVLHTSLIYFIDPHGTERFAAAPMVDHTKKGTAYLPASQLASWGRGIALVARAAGR